MPDAPASPTIGILGSGQLGRMLALAAGRLGLRAHIYSDDASGCAYDVTRDSTVASYMDEQALEKFADSVDVITGEFENIPVTTLTILARYKNVYPSPLVYSIAQDRLLEKTVAEKEGLMTVPYAAVSTVGALENFIATHGVSIVKTRHLGYDGKGQALVHTSAEAANLKNMLTQQPCLVEKKLAFDREVSVLVARNARGDSATYPVVDNEHESGILRRTHAPSTLPKNIADRAAAIAQRYARAVDLVGLLAVEMFVVGDVIYLNEVAPRPHNSGHWTLDACATDQFEQTLRAILNLPLGSTEILYPCTMHNLLGDEIATATTWLTQPRAKLHHYNKSGAVIPRRKLGHVTVPR